MPITKGYLDSRYGQLHYRRSGDSGPGFLLIHQTTNSSRMWDPVIPTLAEHFRVVAFDTPGFGESDPAPSMPSIEEYAAIFADGLTSLGIEKAIVCGFHAGGGFAVQLAASFPDRVEKLILCGVPYFSAEWRADRLSRENIGPTPDPEGAYLMAAFKMFSNPDLAVRNREVVDFLRAGPNCYWAADSIFQKDLTPLLTGIRCPTLICVATKDFLVQTMPRVRDLIPGAELVILPGEVLIADSNTQGFLDTVLAFTGVT